MERFNYSNPVKIHYAPNGLIDCLSEIVGLEGDDIILVYGQQSMERAGVINDIETRFGSHRIHRAGGVKSHPTLADIGNLSEMWFDGKAWVVGIGGGSVIDCAKILAANHTQDFIAIPTTSGTGSEVTPWATIWDFQNRKKQSFEGNNFYAKHAIIDPSLTLSVPKFKTAYTGFDALSHAIEAYWSIHSNPISDMYAIEAIGLIFSNLYETCQYPDRIEHRSAMSLASLYAGLAFSNTKTTAVHSVSYPMTLHYNIPHGVACSLLLTSFWKYNIASIPIDKTQRIYRCWGFVTGDLALNLRHLAKNIGLPTTLKSAGIPREGIEVIIKEGFHPDRVGNNPRTLTKSDLKGILEEIYE